MYSTCGSVSIENLTPKGTAEWLRHVACGQFAQAASALPKLSGQALLALDEAALVNLIGPTGVALHSLLHQRNVVQPTARMHMEQLEPMLDDPASNHCIRKVSSCKIWFDWQRVQEHYGIRTTEQNFIRNLRTNYGWVRACGCEKCVSCAKPKVKGFWYHPDLDSGEVATIRDLRPRTTTSSATTPENKRAASAAAGARGRTTSTLTPTVGRGRKRVHSPAPDGDKLWSPAALKRMQQTKRSRIVRTKSDSDLGSATSRDAQRDAAHFMYGHLLQQQQQQALLAAAAGLQMQHMVPPHLLAPSMSFRPRSQSECPSLSLSSPSSVDASVMSPMNITPPPVDLCGVSPALVAAQTQHESALSQAMAAVRASATLSPALLGSPAGQPGLLPAPHPGTSEHAAAMAAATLGVPDWVGLSSALGGAMPGVELLPGMVALGNAVPTLPWSAPLQSVQSGAAALSAFQAAQAAQLFDPSTLGFATRLKREMPSSSSEDVVAAGTNISSSSLPALNSQWSKSSLSADGSDVEPHVHTWCGSPRTRHQKNPLSSSLVGNVPASLFGTDTPNITPNSEDAKFRWEQTSSSPRMCSPRLGASADRRDGFEWQGRLQMAAHGSSHSSGFSSSTQSPTTEDVPEKPSFSKSNDRVV